MTAENMRTQVGIIGAGPAGLLLSQLLHLAGIDSIVIESKSRHYVEHRVRAGLLEQSSFDLLNAAGLGERMRRESLVHDGINLAFGGALHRIDMHALTGRRVMIYGQQEAVKDMIAVRLAAGGEILFEAEARAIEGHDTGTPLIRFRHENIDKTIACDFVAGCDGFHGIAREAFPNGFLSAYDRTYPFAWLGVLAEAPPSADELIYCHHPNGFALFTMRSPSVSRLYLQVEPDEDVKNWSDDRIWGELALRLGNHFGVKVNEGPISQKSVTPMRSFVAEPMQHGRLFMAGDAAHIVPPTGAKGMNLAVADVDVLAKALIAFFKQGNSDRIDNYTRDCLKRVWRAQHFSWWMTSMLHRQQGASAFDIRRQLAELETVTSSNAGATFLAENYAGLPLGM
jgi:p-hydroxybenzoate 3-monooxygenase